MKKILVLLLFAGIGFAAFKYYKKQEVLKEIGPDYVEIYNQALVAVESEKYADAMQLATQAAEGGYVKAQVLAGDLYYRGKLKNKIEEVQGTVKKKEEKPEPDYAQALKWYQMAASDTETPDMLAQYKLGYMYRYAKGVDRDYNQAIGWFGKSSQQGYCPAMFEIGKMYFNGYGVEQNHQKAGQFFEGSSKSGCPSGDYAAGNMFYKGIGISQDYSNAMKWYLQGAKRGNIKCHTAVGVMYLNGHGVEKDYVKAREWFQKASDSGDGRASYYIGHMYSTGKGVKRNSYTSAKWYLKGALQGNMLAQYNIARKYETGNGVTYNAKKAYMWYKKSASQGYVPAQKTMAIAYTSGESSTQANYQAYKYYLLITKLGNASEVKYAKTKMAYVKPYLSKKLLNKVNNEVSYMYNRILALRGKKITG
ncbi:MAG TPA: SEL1-like repeat protein [Elusimicrobiales bacterium]|nr:SEL1-like repeat protein [Elusimicrobiales bacterium]